MSAMKPRSEAWALWSSIALSSALALGACSATPDASGLTRTNEDLRKPFADGHVADALGMKCGSLDCHGQQARNLRIYSQYGLRLSPGEVAGNNLITQGEIDEDFRSVAGLEPEIFTQVVADGGANPERLTLIRKARGTEAHKGHAIMVVGDAMDTCLTQWLTGAPAASYVGKCDEAAVLPNAPPGTP
jgi:hypothetical protein